MGLSIRPIFSVREDQMDMLEQTFHEGEPICDICGTPQCPQLFHPRVFSRNSGKRIVVCSRHCLDQIKEPIIVNWDCTKTLEEALEDEEWQGAKENKIKKMKQVLIDAGFTQKEIDEIQFDLKLEESPSFKKMLEKTKLEKALLKEVNVKLSNINIVELVYITKEMIEALVDTGIKLYFEQANCYQSCFYICRYLLKSVEPTYLITHETLVDFYEGKRKLSNDSSKLRWEEPCHCPSCNGWRSKESEAEVEKAGIVQG